MFYYKGGLKSKGHTPVYKMHKYFARRPHNVFASLIEHYSSPGDLIFDPFGGGGVTLTEGLTSDRRVISCDTNPVASFIQYSQVLEIDPDEFSVFSNQINLKVQNEFGEFLKTKCTGCKSDAHVRWFEHAYKVQCPECKEETCLSNENVFKKENGKKSPGKYTCENCNTAFRSVDTKRIGSKIVSIRFRCFSCGKHENKSADHNDKKKFTYFQENIEKISSTNRLKIPNDKIPFFWDRQQEDCLHRKGFTHFRDLFTKRNLAISAYYFSVLEDMREELSSDLHDFLVFVISSLLRYTNNMNFSTNNWMNGRPVAWSKHAYWTPNQFIEVNPTEYFGNRVKAAISGIKDRISRFSGKMYSEKVNSLIQKDGDYSITCGDSSQLRIEEDSVDLIITDPPYGSNVQYSELCMFWYVWIKDLIPFKSENFFFANEAVVHRKTKEPNYRKTFQSYGDKLKDVFSNCYKVLKPEGVLVFTFNNKSIEAWYSVIKAAIDSGFVLKPNGIFYQAPIDAYRDTAHQRFDGTPQGDFIYTFIKSSEDPVKAPSSIIESINETVLGLLVKDAKFSIHQFMVELFARSSLMIIEMIRNGKDVTDISQMFHTTRINSSLESRGDLIQTGDTWYLKSKKNAIETL